MNSPDVRTSQLASPARVLVYGVAGSGKSSAAERISAALGVPLHRVDDEIGWLDAETHGPWQLRPEVEIQELFRELAATPRWVLDGCNRSSLPDVLPAADVIIGLDYSRRVVLTRILRRSVFRAMTRTRICHGNVETWRNVLSPSSPVVHVMRTWRGHRRRMRGWAADMDNVVLVSRPGNLDRLIQRLEASATEKPPDLYIGRPGGSRCQVRD